MWAGGVAYFYHAEPAATLSDAMLLATGISSPTHDGGFVRLYAILWPIFLQTFMLSFIATGKNPFQSFQPLSFPTIR